MERSTKIASATFSMICTLPRDAAANAQSVCDCEMDTD
jgi:hypothetical protein